MPIPSTGRACRALAQSVCWLLQATRRGRCCADRPFFCVALQCPARALVAGQHGSRSMAARRWKNVGAMWVAAHRCCRSGPGRMQRPVSRGALPHADGCSAIDHDHGLAQSAITALPATPLHCCTYLYVCACAYACARRSIGVCALASVCELLPSHQRRCIDATNTIAKLQQRCGFKAFSRRTRCIEKTARNCETPHSLRQ